MNPYEELEVGKDATTEEIKRAYKKKAKTTHPDIGGDAEAFDRINQAYVVLSDPEKRNYYDQTGQFKEEMRDRHIHIVINLFKDVLSKNVPFTQNYIDVMQNALRSKHAELSMKITIVEKNKKRLEKVKAKIKYKGKSNNLILRLTEETIGQCDNEIRAYKNELEEIKKAIVFLDNYDFEADEQDVASGGVVFSAVNIHMSNTR